MRFFLPVLALLAPTVALADSGYVPKFARDAQPAQVLAPELCPAPAYPPASLRTRDQGTTIARATIGADGRLTKMQLVQSSGYRDLDRAFLQTFSHCQFRPATVHGQPVQAVMDLQYVWSVK